MLYILFQCLCLLVWFFFFPSSSLSSSIDSSSISEQLQHVLSLIGAEGVSVFDGRGSLYSKLSAKMILSFQQFKPPPQKNLKKSCGV